MGTIESFFLLASSLLSLGCNLFGETNCSTWLRVSTGFPLLTVVTSIGSFIPSAMFLKTLKVKFES